MWEPRPLVMGSQVEAGWRPSGGGQSVGSGEATLLDGVSGRQMLASAHRRPWRRFHTRRDVRGLGARCW